MGPHRLVGVRWGLAFVLSFSVASPAAGQQRFDAPKSDGSRLDWCLSWSAECGKPAADRFCSERDLGPATRFEKARGVGPTLVPSDRRRCEGERCDGFAFIECGPRLRIVLPKAPLSAAAPSPAPTNPRAAPIGNVDPRAPAGERSLGRRAVDRAAIARAEAVPCQPNLLRAFYPPGVRLWYMQGDFPLTSPFAARGGSRSFRYGVEMVPGAEGALWQVATRPFPRFCGVDASTTEPPGLVRSGRVERVEGLFDVPFGELPKPGERSGAELFPSWFVRVVPIAGDPPVPVGWPSEAVAVYDQAVPSASEEELREVWKTQRFERAGVPVHLARFEFVPMRVDHRWPPGCEVYRGRGTTQDPLEWFGEFVLGAADWASETYAEIKGFVVDAVVTILPFVPPEVAAFALDAALASAGIPPNIPNLDQLMEQGADYLASQMADELAAQVPAGHVMAELGKQQLRQEVEDRTRTALLDNARKARAALEARAGEYCDSRTYPPYLKITVRNDGRETYRDVGFTLTASTRLLRQAWFRVDEIEPGESQSVPIDVWSNIVREWGRVDEDPWLTRTAFRFTLTGGRSISWYGVDPDDDYHLDERVIRDGTGIDYTTPERIWHVEPFVGP